MALVLPEEGHPDGVWACRGRDCARTRSFATSAAWGRPNGARRCRGVLYAEASDVKDREVSLGRMSLGRAMWCSQVDADSRGSSLMSGDTRVPGQPLIVAKEAVEVEP